MDNKADESAVFTFRLPRRELEAMRAKAEQSDLTLTAFLRACAEQGLRETQWGMWVCFPDGSMISHHLYPVWSEGTPYTLGERRRGGVATMGARGTTTDPTDDHREHLRALWESVEDAPAFGALPVGTRVVINRAGDYSGRMGTVTHNRAALSPRGAYGIYVRINGSRDRKSYMFFRGELAVVSPEQEGERHGEHEATGDDE